MTTTNTAIPGRRNGFTAPYNVPQISAWGFLLATILHFLLCITPILPLAATIPLTACFLGLVALVIVFGIRSIAIDSMDAYLEFQLRNIPGEDGGQIKDHDSKNKPAPAWKDWIYNKYNPPRTTIPNDNDVATMKQCWICDVQVAETSMHCKYCNKCVGKFDHHCMWLNTCVGERNYEDFFRVMLAILAMQIFHFAMSLALCIDIFVQGPTEARADAWIGSESIAALLILFMAMDAGSMILLIQLIWFHLGLQREQITTYQYIIRDHQRRRDRGKLQRELDQQRTAALQKAKSEGRWIGVCRLSCGEQTRKMGCGDTCDPLNMPTQVDEDDVGFANVLGSTSGTTSNNDHNYNDSTTNMANGEYHPQGGRTTASDENDEEAPDDETYENEMPAPQQQASMTEQPRPPSQPAEGPRGGDADGDNVTFVPVNGPRGGAVEAEPSTE